MKELLTKIIDKDDKKTIELFKQFKDLSKQEFLTKEQLIKILRWKSPRPLKYYESNNEESIIEITKLAFSTSNDCLKIHILTALKGVNYPAASAILMFYDPSKYPVIDIRVWQQLYKAKLVYTNSQGKNFSLSEWDTYLIVIRRLAYELNITPRQVEKRLYDYDIITRKSKLYN